MIEYQLSVVEPHLQLVDVEIRVAAATSPLKLMLPSWTPGSYLLREYARHLERFEALGSTSEPLPWRKTAKNVWEVECPASGPVTVRYSVFANELTVRTSHVDSTHAYINGASVFLWVVGADDERHRIAVTAPEGWRVATSLPEIDGAFEAEDYDELVDSPFEIGTHRLLAWEQEGVPHRWAIWGEPQPDDGKLLADTRKIVDSSSRMFGGLPYDRYLFLLHVTAGGRGGLEHTYSTSLQVAPEIVRGSGYERLLALTAHELFHVWLGKRIRPEPLADFDYSTENYTRNLWVIEGFTTYYTDRLLLGSGLMTAERYLLKLGESIARLQSLPGRYLQTLEEASFDAWIRFYRPGAHTPNSQISYYHKGALVALILDLEIRRATKDERSLDDVLRLLWSQYGKVDKPFPEDRTAGIQAAVETIGGSEVAHLLARYVSTTEEIAFPAHLDAAGLRLCPSAEATDSQSADRSAALAGRVGSPNPDPQTPSPREMRLGIRSRVTDGGKHRVTHVLSGLPASLAGLNPGDHLVAVNGSEATEDALDQLSRELPAGSRIGLLVLRRGRTFELTLNVGPPVQRQDRLCLVPHAPAEAINRRNAWLRGPSPAS